MFLKNNMKIKEKKEENQHEDNKCHILRNDMKVEKMKRKLK